MAVFKRPENSPRMKAMAEKLGVNLEKGVEEGQLSKQEVRLAAHRCGECVGTLECKIWFAAREGEPQDEAPTYCPNHELYAKLKD